MIKIAHFGTFDVDNYGDLLFPHLAEYRLSQYEWNHISPTNNKTIFKDSKPIVSFNYAKKKKYDAVVIGGGNILHLLDNRRTVYNNKEGFAYANLWVGSAKIAMKQRIPYIFNAPGISKKFSHLLHKRIALFTFNNSNYVALRERFSAEMAKRMSIGKSNLDIEIQIVPDTAFDIANMWPLETENSSEYISVNVNQRYHKPIQETAENLDKISKKLHLPIKFVVIGDCHEDLEFTHKISKKMKAKHQVVESNSLKNVAHVIGHSNYFFGSSMHGFITALSYGVPSFLILNKKPLHKFIGLLEITELDKSIICESFNDVFEILESPAILHEEVKQKIKYHLDKHWKHIDQIIKNKSISKFSRTVKNYKKLLLLQLKYNEFRNRI